MNSVTEHYEAVAANYQQQYDKSTLYTSKKYKANYIRLQILLNSFVNNGSKRVIEVGVGEGTPLAALGRSGLEVWGFDISPKMVELSKQKLKDIGQNEEHIFVGDIQDPISYIHAVKDGSFDSLMAMGVMPHIKSDTFVLNNMATLIKPGGSVFIEFRNKLFSLFTFNRYTYEFILDDLLQHVSPELKSAFGNELQKIINMNAPEYQALADQGAPGYDAILSRFHNPFEVQELFEKNGFQNIKFHWYHYHPIPPVFEALNPSLYRHEALELEHESSGWRGMFLCSAFVVEAQRA